MKLTFPIQTVSEANQSESWHVKYKRKKSQQLEFFVLWRNAKVKVQLPATVIFTRYSCKVMDSDNLAGAFKHVQDSLAKELGVDDGSSLIEWRYGQEQIKKRKHYFTVEIL